MSRVRIPSSSLAIAPLRVSGLSAFRFGVWKRTRPKPELQTLQPETHQSPVPHRMPLSVLLRGQNLIRHSLHCTVFEGAEDVHVATAAPGHGSDAAALAVAGRRVGAGGPIADERAEADRRGHAG